MTPSGVRLRLWAQRPGAFDWLFVPGGPGLGSESLAGLVDVVAVPGRSWLVDLPGDGSNRDGVGVDPYERWPDVLAEAVDDFAAPVMVGHSTGGMYALSVSELEASLVDLALVSSAPDARWRELFAANNEALFSDDMVRLAQAYEAHPTDENLRALTIASSHLNFTDAGQEAGTKILAGLPFNHGATDWSDRNFDADFESKWWPKTMPTLIVSGSDDRVVDQALWDEERFAGPNVTRTIIDGGGHFPWVEAGGRVHAAFAAFAAVLIRSRP